MMKIAKKLHPLWFDKNAISKSMPIDLRIHKSYVAEEGKDILGFLTYTSDSGKARISWIGVDPLFHSRGIGSKLLKKLEKELKRMGVKDLRVQTVGKCNPKYEPYEKTVKFYKTLGFKVESKSAIKIYNSKVVVKAKKIVGESRLDCLRKKAVSSKVDGRSKCSSLMECHGRHLGLRWLDAIAWLNWTTWYALR